MDDSEKLVELRIILDDMGADSDDDDATLLSYLEMAKYKILNRRYPYLDDDELEEKTIPKRWEHKQIEIAAYMLNKRGAEGETQHIENGIHRNYKSADVPEEMLRDIPPYCGIPR